MNAPEAPHLTFRVDRGVARLTFNRPEKYNSMSLQLLDLFERALADIEKRSDVRVILIDSIGKHFCTGADIDIVLKCVKQGQTEVEAWLNRGQRLFARLEASPLPTVVAIQGLCLAGGLELMLACDIAFMAETARIGDQHINFGFLPAWGSTERLPQLIGKRRALDLMYSGRMLTSMESIQIGLVNRVVPDEKLEEESLAYSATLATRSRSALTAMKRMVQDSGIEGLEQAHRRETKFASRQLQSRDGEEGFNAFREKRKPVFK